MSLLSHEERDETHGAHFYFFSRSGQCCPSKVKPACSYITMFQDDEQESPVRSGQSSLGTRLREQ